MVDRALAAESKSQSDAQQTQDYLNKRNYKSLAQSQTKFLNAQKKENASPFQLMATLLTLGNAQLSLNQFAAAESTFETGCKLAAQTKDKEQIANFERQLGTLAMRQSNYKQATSHYLEALRIDEPKGRGTLARGSAKDHYCLGRFLEKQEKWLEAKDEYNLSVDCFEFAYGRNCEQIMVPIWCLYMCAKGRRDSVEEKLCWAKLQQLQQVHKDFLLLPVEQEREFFDLWFTAPKVTKL